MVRLDADSVTLQFGAMAPVTMPWSEEDSHARARLLAVLKQASRTTPPGTGQVQVQAPPESQAGLERLLEEALGSREGFSTQRRQGILNWPVLRDRLPLVGLVLLAVFLALSAWLERSTLPASSTVAPPPPPALRPLLAGASTTLPVGWLESLAQQMAASGAGEWRSVSIKHQGAGMFQLSLRMEGVTGARVMGDPQPKSQGVRQVLERLPGRVSVQLQETTGEWLVEFKPPAQGPGGSMEDVDLTGPVQSIATQLAQWSSSLTWSQIRKLSIERDPQQLGLARFRLETMSTGGGNR